MSNPKPIKGDYNGDGHVTKADDALKGQDVNDDGFINTKDSQSVLSLNSNTTLTNNPSSGSSSGRSTGITPKVSAESQLDQILVKLLGRRGTVAEKSAYVKGLNALQKQYATISSGSSSSKTTKKNVDTSSSSSSSTSYSFDENSYLLNYAEQIAGKTIAAGKPLGGTAGDAYNTLVKYANDMGLSSADALSNTIKIAKGDTDQTKVQNGMQKRAVALYGSFSDQLKADPTLTLKDAAQDYTNTMSQMLDIPVNSIKLTDPTISRALQATDASGKPRMMTTNEFGNLLRDDHRFQYGAMAHKEAIDMASSFASAMGFGV